MNKVLLAHVEVYQAAEYYNIPMLKVLATERFNTAAKADWKIDGFLEVVKAVNQRSFHSDRQLRDALRGYGIKHVIELAADEDFMSDLMETEDVQDFAADMFRQTVRLREADKRAQSTTVAKKDEELRAAEQRRDTLVRQNARGVDSVRAECNHVEKVMNDLVAFLGNLPRGCGYRLCNRELTRLKFERKNHVRFGPAKGGWTVRCRCDRILLS